MKSLTLSIIIILVMLSCKTTKHSIQKKGSLTQENPVKYKPLKTFQGDTLKYVLYNFIQNKDKYINQPLSVFTDAIKIDFRSYITGDGNTKSKFFISGIYLEMFEYVRQEKKIAAHQDPIEIYVDFKDEIAVDTTDRLLKLDHGVWTGESKKFYEKQIIKDIKLVKYNFQK